jgi:hypothetical protein
MIRTHVVQLAVAMGDECSAGHYGLSAAEGAAMNAMDLREIELSADGLLSSQLRHHDKPCHPCSHDQTLPGHRILAAANAVILGKSTQTRLALCCLLAKGHLLIEDLPGVGKTTLAHTLARLLGFQFSRVQFTSDMLPADILGVSIFDRERGNFRFLPGPVFSQVLLADEINRATPKTQSALLEAMEEGQVTTEGETRPLPEPFFVIATQNPSTRSAPSPCPNRNSIAFCCASNSATRTTTPSARCSKAVAGASSCRRCRLPRRRRVCPAATAGGGGARLAGRCSTTCNCWSKQRARSSASCTA